MILEVIELHSLIALLLDLLLCLFLLLGIDDL
jgi:hypothetical protein